LANTCSRVKFITYLSHENVARTNMLPAETLHPASLRIGIATITTRTLTFFMCHRYITFITSPGSTLSRWSP
jgi:hypothetical protein